MKRAGKIVAAVIALVFVVTGFLGARYIRHDESAGKKEETKRVSKTEKKDQQHNPDKAAASAKKIIRVENPVFSRLSDREIRISWSDEHNPYVEKYILRRSGKDGGWRVIGTLTSDHETTGRELALVDTLEDTSMQQYTYRVDVQVKDEDLYEPLEGETFLASNILICIDPGHFAGRNLVRAKDGLAYAEGDFTLEIAKELNRILLENYGVTSVMTRDSGSITIGGYSDGELDGRHISLRGEYAKGSNLFLSLHTNANLENANGYATDEQPIHIDKPILIVNETACNTDYAINIANAVGENLTAASYEMGITSVETFQKVERMEDIREWTDQYNDSLNVPGTVCRRRGSSGDYYGVLRGASNVEVPGIIIEHGFHTVSEVREQALNGNLKTKWAQADALGIAEGLGLKKREE